MRKRVIARETQGIILGDEEWLELESLAQAELTFEDASHPIESALKPGAGLVCRALETGRQTIRLLLDRPLRVKLIHLVFQEKERQRTQEFLLRWSSHAGSSHREIVRQRYNSAPPQTSHEIEDLEVDLAGLIVLELSITPGISGGNARASIEMSTDGAFIWVYLQISHWRRNPGVLLFGQTNLFNLVLKRHSFFHSYFRVSSSVMAVQRGPAPFLGQGAKIIIPSGGLFSCRNIIRSLWVIILAFVRGPWLFLTQESKRERVWKKKKEISMSDIMPLMLLS